MRTCSLHSRQLCLQSEARKLPGDHYRQRDAERCIGNWNRKLEAKKTKYNTKSGKSVANSKQKCALVLCVDVSFACNQKLAYCRLTMKGSAMQSGALATRTEN
jgi:hypothetical protein